jgi:hypothetical protein
VRSILRFVFVVVPTAALASAVVIGVSYSGERAAATSDGDLQRDLKLAATTTLELAPAGRPLATVSSIEAPPTATPARSVRLKRSSSGPRAVRSRAPVVRAAPEPEVADAAEESEGLEATELAATTEASAEAPDAGGVALPRPTAVPVIFPTSGGGETYDPGPGSVIRGGVLDGDHCQIHGRGRPVYGPPIYRQPTATRGGSVSDRMAGIRRPGQVSGSSGSVAGRIREGQGRRSSGSTSSGSGRGSIAGRLGTLRGGR